MPVPATILQMLETNNIVYALKATEPQIASAPANPCHVRSQILEDSHGRVQALLPANALLDLELIAKQFGRQFKAVSRQEMRPILAVQNLTSVPAMPAWQGMATLVDAAILQHSAVWLESGDRSQLVEMQSSDFQALIKNANVGNLAVSAPQLPVSAESDKAQILDSVSLFTKRRIKQRLEDTLELPPLSETAQRIIQLRANPRADISDLAKIVELDPSLTAQVVSWASSPYYSAPGKIKSVQDAIVRVLGFDMVMNLALGLSLGKSFNTSVITPQQMNTYWRNAVATAAVVEGLVTSMPRTERPSFGLAYLAGLLHNFGYLILAEVFPPYFVNLNRHFEVNSPLPQGVVEQHLIGVSSCQVASWLLESWQMPTEVVVALRQQFNPAYRGEHSVYANLIFVATQLLANRGFSEREAMPIPASMYQALNLSADSVEITINNILESGDDLASIAEKMQG